MGRIFLRRPHRLSAKELRARAESIARRIEQRHDVRWRWEGDRLELNAPTGLARGTSGTVTVGEDHVEIEISLALPLRPVRRMVEGQLRARVDALLGLAAG
jgi:putative polyhydroxyalkanoate system protein